MPDLSDRDIGISQLTVLINELFTAGDIESAKTFVTRAVKLPGLTAFERSEALRLEGRYFFASGDFAKGRQSYMAALSVLGDLFTAARAYDLADLIPMEYRSGDCENAGADLLSFAKMMNSPQVPPQSKVQMVTTLKAAVSSVRGQSCPEVSNNLDAIVVTTQTNP